MNDVIRPHHPPAHRSVAVILAGGVGKRLGQATPKQLLEVAGRPIIEHAMAAFSAASIDEIMVVMAHGYVADAQRIADAYEKVTAVIEGGSTRTESTSLAISALADRPDDTRVLFHDAARPFVDQRIIADCLHALDSGEAVAVGVASADTIVMVENGLVVDMPSRGRLRRFQTPQGFRLRTIRKAYELALADPDFAAMTATDDCGVVHRYLPLVAIRVIEGSEENIKVTHPLDLVLAEELRRRAEQRAVQPG